ncbi:hypothetical protein NXV10_00320 [Bacteroides thetaiotaomicron]|nr:hypothetical protein [Bacteroides thetaiotaomicron]
MKKQGDWSWWTEEIIHSIINFIIHQVKVGEIYGVVVMMVVKDD